MKAARYMLFTMSGVFVAPITLAFLGSVIPLSEDSSLAPLFYVPHMFISGALYDAGASRTFVSTGGHLAHLTTLGVFAVYLIPAVMCFVSALLLRQRHSHESHTA